MSCNFNLNFSESPDVAIGKARAAVESQNGIFNGDINSGNFEVTAFGNTIKGKYTVAGQTLNLQITDKPFLIPCSMIENFLLKQIS
ncbi:MAG: hypothetical protein M3Z26_03345 [Bacteroidota bacterium]|nr:hypothetical protein [Bacteroidota bacterium]